jgi:hypothetical protein
MSRERLAKQDSSGPAPQSSAFRAKGARSIPRERRRWHRRARSVSRLPAIFGAPFSFVSPIIVATNSMSSRICPGDGSAGSLVARCDISCQSASRTAPAWMLATCFAYMIIDERLAGDGRPARSSGLHLTLPESRRRADRFGHQVLTRLEVLGEAAHSKTGFFHRFGDSDPSKAFLAEPL